MLGLVNRYLFSNNRLKNLHGAISFNAKKENPKSCEFFKMKKWGLMPIVVRLMDFNLVQ